MIGSTIAHYRIIEKLGEGGMGVVYKAEDSKLKRFVAIKFLPRHIASQEEERERFVLEAQAAAALNHPNIATIHAIEEVDDEMFIVMEYIEGEELQKKVSSEQLSVNHVIEIAAQIAEGLKTAHARGIIHRDIKSGNIMVTESGQVKIMDFGLAKIGKGAHLTKSGMTVGTVAYMSPEQVRGEEVDHRTDIWSFCVVLYEMLTGRLPFRGEYEAAMLYSILNESPKLLITSRSDLPKYLQPVIDRALEKDRTRRYQNVQDFIKDLKERSPLLTTSTEPQKSIVVLPFEDISPAKDNEYFSDGLTEEIIADLSKIQALRVISRTSAMMLKGTKKDLKTIGRELNVQYALEGSVRKAGNNLRITAQLIDAANDAHLWAEKYNGTLEDVFDMQESVSRAIVDALKLKLSPEENRRMAERPIANVHAYECYLRARQAVFQATPDSLERALQYLKNGLDILGENALLYAGIGYVYFQFVNVGIKQEDYIKKAEECVQKIFALEPDSPYGHFPLGLFQQLFYGNPQQSVNHFKQALISNPNDPDILFWLVGSYALVGKTFAGAPLAERLLRIDPLNSMNQAAQGFIHWLGADLIWRRNHSTKCIK